MKKQVAEALKHFVDMNKGDQQDYLDALIDYVYAGRREKSVTLEKMLQSITIKSFAGSRLAASLAMSVQSKQI